MQGLNSIHLHNYLINRHVFLKTTVSFILNRKVSWVLMQLYHIRSMVINVSEISYKDPMAQENFICLCNVFQ